jgi:hypothetical protein
MAGALASGSITMLVAAAQQAQVVAQVHDQGWQAACMTLPSMAVIQFGLWYVNHVGGCWPRMAQQLMLFSCVCSKKKST